MRTDGGDTYKGFSAIVKDLNFFISNEINLIYFREYIHPWEKAKYKVTKTASKIFFYDGLGENADDYIWVKYDFTYYNINSEYYPYINANNYYLKENIDEVCKVFSSELNLMNPEVDESYHIPIKYIDTHKIGTSIFVGYSKNIYNENSDNLIQTNYVELMGIYKNENTEEKLSDSSITINLQNFLFNYSGNLYGITKHIYTNNQIPDDSLKYQDIIKGFGHNYINSYLYPTTVYTGNDITVKIDDDLLMATSMDGNYIKLSDDEYYFNSITFNNSNFKNNNKVSIPLNKYELELHVRYKNSNNYVLYESLLNSTKTWNFTEDNGIVGFYFKIYDMSEGISYITTSKENALIYSKITLTKKDIPENGTLCNFSYLQIYFRDLNKNLILQNEQNINSYANFITKEEIAQFDLNTYGFYQQISYSSMN